MLFIEANKGLGFPVTIKQTRVNRFTVTYGENITIIRGLTPAMNRFTSCIAHSMECMGLKSYDK